MPMTPRSTVSMALDSTRLSGVCGDDLLGAVALDGDGHRALEAAHHRLGQLLEGAHLLAVHRDDPVPRLDARHRRGRAQVHVAHARARHLVRPQEDEEVDQDREEQVEGRAGDTVNVRTIDGHTVVTTGAGADLVLVSSLADAADGALSDPTGAVPGGDVDGIDGFLEIDAGGAADRLVVDDSGETADDIGRVTSDEISGLGMTVDPTHAPADAVHVITVRDAEDGTFTITVDGQTTAAIAFDAKQDVVRDAIVAALGVSANDVTVTRSPVLRTSGITYRITFVGALAGQAGRDLGSLTVDDAALVSVPGGTASAVPTAMSDGRIHYVGFEDLDLELGAASDQLALDSTGAVTTVGGGAGDDVIDVETIDHVTRIDGDGGDDTLTVNRQPTALPATGNGIAALPDPRRRRRLGHDRDPALQHRQLAHRRPRQRVHRHQPARGLGLRESSTSSCSAATSSPCSTTSSSTARTRTPSTSPTTTASTA